MGAIRKNHAQETVQKVENVPVDSLGDALKNVQDNVFLGPIENVSIYGSKD